MLKLLFGVMLLTLACTSLAFGADPSPNLDQVVSGYLQRLAPVPDTGVALAVIKDGKVIFSRTYGFRDRKHKLPVTDQTLFAIGSNTKDFTATALAILRDRGVVDFDVPVKTYLPDFQLSDPEATNESTLEDLLSHRTGMPAHDDVWYLTTFSSDDLYQRLKYLPFSANPLLGFRRSFQYNNLMYMVAGKLLERVQQASWADIIRSEIVEPLGMTHTIFTNQDIQQFSDYALPYVRERIVPFNKTVASVAPAGSIVSNLVDMEKWVLFLQANGKSLSGDQLVSEKNLQAMQVPLSDPSAEFTVPMKEGMGWFINQIDGQKVIWNGGNIDGFSAHVSFLPDAGLGMVILTNQNDASLLEYPIAFPATQTEPIRYCLPWVIYHSLLSSSSPIVLQKSTTKATPALPPTSAQPNDLNKYVGTYWNPGYGELSVTRVDGHLVLTYYRNVSDLSPKSQDHFWFYALSDAIEQPMDAVFSRSSDSSVNGISVTFEQAVSPIYFTKKSN